METLKTQLLVVGAGPAGYVCAIRAGQLGLKTIIVEEDKPGGTCLNVGCIPSKALIHAADEYYRVSEFCQPAAASSGSGITADNVAIDLRQTMLWKEGIVKRLNSGVSGLLKKAGVTSLAGTARFEDGKTVVVINAGVETRIQADNIVVATGSEPVALSGMPFGGNVISSTGALSLQEVPQHLAVVGGGYIGLELGTSYAKLGSQVTIVESAERILPQYDAELTAPVLARLKNLGVTVLTETLATAYSDTDQTLNVRHTDSEGSTEQCIKADKVLVTVGRRARLSGWGLTELSLTTQDNFIAIDDHCQTSMRGVFAIGDVTGEPMLAHRAMAQGDLVARHLAGENVSWDKQCIPAVCFTDPEIVTVGLSPEQAASEKSEPDPAEPDSAEPDQGQTENEPQATIVATFPFAANGRAMSLQREEGFIRVVAQPGTNIVLGVQAVGAGVSELSAAFSLAIEMGALLDDVAATIHAHPTLSEGFQEACLKALGQGLHH